MAQPEYALVIRRLTKSGTPEVVTIKQLHVEFYGVTGAAYTYPSIELWTGRAFHLMTGAAEIPATPTARSADYIKDTGIQTISIYTTSTGGVYVGTKLNTQMPGVPPALPAEMTLLSKSYKIALSQISAHGGVDTAGLPVLINNAKDHSPLGYGISLGTISSALVIGQSQTYAINTTISPENGAGARDPDGVYWSSGVIVDCEIEYTGP